MAIRGGMGPPSPRTPAARRVPGAFRFPGAAPPATPIRGRSARDPIRTVLLPASTALRRRLRGATGTPRARAHRLGTTIRSLTATRTSIATRLDIRSAPHARGIAEAASRGAKPPNCGSCGRPGILADAPVTSSTISFRSPAVVGTIRRTCSGRRSPQRERRTDTSAGAVVRSLAPTYSPSKLAPENAAELFSGYPWELRAASNGGSDRRSRFGTSHSK